MKRTEKIRPRRQGRPKKIGPPRVSVMVRIEREDADGFADYSAKLGVKSIAGGVRALALQGLRQEREREAALSPRPTDNG